MDFPCGSGSGFEEIEKNCAFCGRHTFRRSCNLEKEDQQEHSVPKPLPLTGAVPHTARATLADDTPRVAAKASGWLGGAPTGCPPAENHSVRYGADAIRGFQIDSSTGAGNGEFQRS